MLKQSLTFLLTISFLTLPVFCQTVERKSVTLPQISEVKSSLTNASGWVFTKDDQWVEGKNELPAYSKNYKLTPDNFISLELREVSVDGKTYSLLIKRMTRRAYKYPALELEPYNYEAILWYVFDKDKLNKIIEESPAFNKSYAVDLEVIFNGVERVYQYLERDYMKEISCGIQEQLSSIATLNHNI